MIIDNHPIYVRTSGKHVGFIVCLEQDDYILVNPFIENKLYGTVAKNGQECLIPKQQVFNTKMWCQATDILDWFPQEVKENIMFVSNDGLESIN